jgi:hypothetical protein
MHHCMVDGTAVVELGRLLLDADPDARESRGGSAAWSPAPAPSPGERLARAVVDLAADGAALALAPMRLAGSSARLRELPAAAGRSARTLAHTLLSPAPPAPPSTGPDPPIATMSASRAPSTSCARSAGDSA